MDEKAPPPGDYILLRTDSGPPDHFSPPSRIRRETGGFGTADFEISAGFSDNAFDEFTNGQKNQHSRPFENHGLAINRNDIIFLQPPPIKPPPYSPSCSYSITPPRADFENPFFFDARRPYHIYSDRPFPPTATLTSAEYLQPKSSQNGLDPRVQTVKLADDPGRSESGGDDRPHESHGDRRPELPSPFRPGPITPISSTSNPYSPYWSHPEQPPAGFGPYDRPRSPPRPYPFPPPSSTYPPPYQPPHPSTFPPPVPPSYPISQPYPHPNPYDYPGLPPPSSPYVPRTMPFSHGSRLPHGGIINTSIAGVLPMPPLNLEPPPTHRFLIPPGAETEYRISVRQQPVRARMCGFGEKDRRPIDPPPVVELTELKGPSSPDDLKSLILQTTIYNEEGTEHRGIIRTTIGATAGLGSAEELPVQPEEKHARVLMGNHFGSFQDLEDETGKRGLFVMFPDLSIRVEGRYRLKFDLLRVFLPPEAAARPSQIIAECLSDIFVVYAAKKFPGMMQSTKLTLAFQRQGVKVSIRSEERVRRDRPMIAAGTGRPPKKRTSISSNEEDDEAASISSDTKRIRSAER